jgi:site-specific DNA recombinase
MDFMTGNRALLVSRLSIRTDETTSPERQRQITEQAASIKDLVVVGVAEDLDVSASKFSPFERPVLGDWLNNRADEFDVLIVWRLDRLIRKVSDLADIIKWAQANGKNVVSATESFDLSTDMGRAMAYMIGIFAEMEAGAISTRVTDSHKALRTQGRWGGGGGKPFWLRAVKRDGGVYLEHDPDQAAQVRKAVDLRLSKKMSGGKIAATLGEPWHSGMVMRHLRSPWLLGQREHDGKVVRDSAGLPVQFCEPLVTQDEWKQLQADVRAVNRSGEPYLLRGLIYCANCERAMSRHKVERGRAVYANYRCMTKPHLTVQCDNRAVAPMGLLDANATAAFLDEMGEVEISEPVFVAGSDHTAELERVRNALEGVREEYDAGLYEGDRAGYMSRLRDLKAKETALAALPQQPDRWERIGTGRTYGQEWSGLSVEDRNQLLSELNMRVVVGVGETPFTLYDSPEADRYNLAFGFALQGRNGYAIVSWDKQGHPVKSYEWQEWDTDRLRSVLNEGYSDEDWILDPHGHEVYGEVLRRLKEKGYEVPSYNWQDLM